MSNLLHYTVLSIKSRSDIFGKSWNWFLFSICFTLIWKHIPNLYVSGYNWVSFLHVVYYILILEYCIIWTRIFPVHSYLDSSFSSLPEIFKYLAGSIQKPSCIWSHIFSFIKLLIKFTALNYLRCFIVFVYFAIPLMQSFAFI